MAQTGTIYGYHDGATYSLANIYDERLSEYNEQNTLYLFHFDGTEGCIDVGNLWNSRSNLRINLIYNNANHFYTSNSADTNNLANLKTDMVNFISTENAKFDYALQFNKTNKNSLLFSQNGIFGFYDYGNAFTIEMWVAIQPTLSSETGRLYSVKIANASSGQSLLTHIVNYAYSNSNNIVVPKILDVELPSETFNAPFHFAEVISNYGRDIKTFVNGSLIKTSTSSHSTANAVYIYLGTIQISDKSVPGNVTLSELRFSKGSWYTDNFSVPTAPLTATLPVPANMLIRHNAANHYIPLTTSTANTSAPYIAVRHGNTNFYTLK